MKRKYVWLVLIFVSLSFTSIAQSVTIGPRLGVNFGRQIVSGDDSDITDAWNDEVKSATGLQAGLVANFMINEVFSLQPELLYTQKGYKFEEDNETATGRYDYLDVPILAKFTIGNGPLKGFVTAGPTLSYWLSGEDKFESGSLELSEDIDFDNEDDGIENQFEAGASLGLGAAYDLGGGALNLDLRYNIGLTSVYDSDDDAKLRNEGFGISLAYLFSL